jgi:hypothetical protein
MGKLEVQVLLGLFLFKQILKYYFKKLFCQVLILYKLKFGKTFFFNLCIKNRMQLVLIS